MKRILIILAILFNLVFINYCANEDPVSSGDCSGDGRGACSSHNGVNCAAGPDSDGSVICNDGWRNSSVAFCAVCGG